MDLLPTLVSGIDIFLLVTYVGIGIYLAYLYRKWGELSVGSWALGSLTATIAIVFHLFSIYSFNQGGLYTSLYRLATVFTFIAAWFFGISHPIARRQTTDIVLIVLLSIPLGFILPYIVQELSVTAISGLIFEEFSPSFNTFDLLNFLFYGILYLTFARDSHLIYNASIKNVADTYRKSIAITHLLAWQFFAVGTAALRYLSKFTGTPVYFGLPFIFLLVPLLTLGSRPFDWAREGHEPRILLLVDRHGTPTYSWTKQAQTPLFLEGSTLATIADMLEHLVNEPLEKTEIHFKNMTLYTQHHLGYLSILLTTGPHKSFQNLLSRIHEVLVTDVVRQNEAGILGYEFPLELQWLLSQLLPNSEFEMGGPSTIKKLLQNSGLQLQ